MGILFASLVAAGITAWLWQKPTELPQANRQDLSAAQLGSVGPATSTSAVSSSAGHPDEGPQPVRIAVPSTSAPNPDEQPCALQVLVQTEYQGVRSPAAFADVTVRLPQSPLPRMLVRTDARGVAALEFGGGDGATVIAEASIGGRGQAVLSSEQATNLTIVVATKLFATGRVMDSSNVGVGDADIVVLGWAYDDGWDQNDSGANDDGNDHAIGRMRRVGRSTRDGQFKIALGIGGRIGASHPQYASSAMYLLRPNASQPPTQTFELLLRSESAAIVGIICDHTGRPIGNAQIEARSITGGPSEADLAGPPSRARSDSEGRFSLRGLAIGDTQWQARARGHGWAQGRLALTQTTNNQLGVQLPAASTLSGMVVDQATGAAIAGATVRAGEPGTLCHRITRSDASGNYQLEDLGTGLIPVSAQLDQQRSQAQLQLSPLQPVTWRAELTQTPVGMQLHGVVLDPQKQPLSRWLVVVRQFKQSPLSALTDEEGRFAIPVSQANELDVRCYEPGRQPTSFANLREANARADQPLTLIANRRASATIMGRVVASSAAGVPASIGCWHDDLREYARYTADGDGNFVIADAPAGPVYLTIEHPGHAAHETDKLQLQPGLPMDLGTIQLALGGGLYGTVIGPTGSAPDDCQLMLLIEQPKTQMSAEYVGGSYRFANVPAGRHTLLVQGPGLAGASFSITIAAGVDLPRDIELQQGLHRRIRVRVPADGGRRVTLALRVPDTTTQWFATGDVQREQQGGPGYALFDTWMTAGTYEAVAYSPQGYSGRATVTYNSTDAPPFALQLSPP
jgi:hypothetical protein